MCVTRLLVKAQTRLVSAGGPSFLDPRKCPASACLTLLRCGAPCRTKPYRQCFPCPIPLVGNTSHFPNSFETLLRGMFLASPPAPPLSPPQRLLVAAESLETTLADTYVPFITHTRLHAFPFPELPQSASNWSAPFVPRCEKDA